METGKLVGVVSWGQGCALSNYPGGKFHSSILIVLVLPLLLRSNILHSLSISGYHNLLTVYSRVDYSIGHDFITKYITQWSSSTTPPSNSWVKRLTTTTSEFKLGCSDKGGFYDSRGVDYNCMWYAGTGTGTSTRCSQYGNSAHAGVTANMACCACGGGVRAPSPPTTSTPTRIPTTMTPTAPCLGMNVEVKIMTDRYASETSWTLTNQCDRTVITGGGYTQNEMLYSVRNCLPTGKYSFTIKDMYGDGICCSLGNGYYEVVVNGNTTLTGGQFRISETKTFGSECAVSPITSGKPTSVKPTTRTPTSRPTNKPKPTTSTPTHKPTSMKPTASPTSKPTSKPTASPTTPEPTYANEPSSAPPTS